MTSRLLPNFSPIVPEYRWLSVVVRRKLHTICRVPFAPRGVSENFPKFLTGRAPCTLLPASDRTGALRTSHGAYGPRRPCLQLPAQIPPGYDIFSDFGRDLPFPGSAETHQLTITSRCWLLLSASAFPDSLGDHPPEQSEVFAAVSSNL
jgi:hypothetical protein